MGGNTIGKIFSVTTFGESHGSGIGVVIDGVPSGMPVDIGFLNVEMKRRRPGQSNIVTRRSESDEVEIISGVFEGRTTGTPLTLFIRNEDARSKDYSHLKEVYRPSHADFTYQKKYGIRDYYGGGRSSARETAARVAAGAIAKMILKQEGIRVSAYVSSVGEVELRKPYTSLDLSLTEDNKVRCPDPEIAEVMIQKIGEVRKAGDSIGGTITGIIYNCPAGLGEPVFDKLHADLGKAMLSINACKGFEYGSGFSGTMMRGSEHNDIFDTDHSRSSKVITKTNYSGGIQGGISNGMDIYFKLAFKPVATIIRQQETIDEKGNKVILKGKGRHDPCVVPRAVPIVEAMAAITVADHLLRNKVIRFSLD